MKDVKMKQCGSSTEKESGVPSGIFLPRQEASERESFEEEGSKRDFVA